MISNASRLDGNRQLAYDASTLHITRYDASRGLAFMHIAKTSGTALKSGLLKALSPKSSLWGQDRHYYGSFDRFDTVDARIVNDIYFDVHSIPTHLDFIGGEFAFSTLSSQCGYMQIITFLREPFSRLLSHWAYNRALRDDMILEWGEEYKRRILKSRQTLADYLSSRELSCQLDNLALRTLLWPHPLIPEDNFIDPRNDEVLIDAARAKLAQCSYTDIIENPSFHSDLEAWLGRDIA